MSKKKARQAQREQLRVRQLRQRRLLYIGAAVVAALVLIGIGVFAFGSKPADSSGAPISAGNCSDVQTIPDEGRGHLNSGDAHTYAHIPPTSGVHDPDPWPQGVFDNPIPETREVHSLEHGYVILHYNGIPADQVQQLGDIARQDPRKIIVSPFPTMPYKVSLTAWNHIQSCEAPNATVIRSFIQQFRDQGPEQSPF